MKTRLARYLALTCLLMALTAPAQIAPKVLAEWKDQKYSMFIHFGGIYSVLGGVWNDKPVTIGLSEQIQAHAGIYSDTYAGVARRFDPEKWNADTIAGLAKRAGMRSVVITSKHHDGFCMFKTTTTDFNVVEATPFKRDVIREMSDACKRQGLSFGLYFSLIDWHFPQAMPISSHNSDTITPEHFVYNKKQVTELLTNYGPVSELWFDMGSQTLAQSQEMRELVHRLQPNCLIGSRIGNDMGDFTVTGDNQQPDYTIGVPWQSPASFFDETWGYRSWQKRVPEDEKTREKLTSLIRVVSRGGKYLLNIGPKGDGSVVPYERDVLLTMGRWIDKNRDAIYGTAADPFYTAFAWGSITARPTKLYLFLLSMPADGVITLPGLTGQIKSVAVLGETAAPIRFVNSADGQKITVPGGLDVTKEFKVLVVDFVKGYTVAPYKPITLTATTRLNSDNAFKHYSNSGVDYNTRYQSIIENSWTIKSAKTTTIQPALTYSDEEKGQSIDLAINGKISAVSLSGGEMIPLKGDPKTLTYGPLFLAGPASTGLDDLPKDVQNIDVDKPWNSLNWQKKADWKQGEVYTLPADLRQGYYLLQTITSPTDQPLLVGVTSGDGVLVLLNGKTLLIHNNPEKSASEQDIIRLDLKKGENQLLVRSFNNFRKQTTIGIDPQVPQHVYRKPLPPVQLPGGAFYPVSWQMHQPVSPHRTLILPNLSLDLSTK